MKRRAGAPSREQYGWRQWVLATQAPTFPGRALEAVIILALLRYSDWATGGAKNPNAPTRLADLAKRVHASPRRVLDAIARLRNAGLIGVTSHAGRGGANVYQVAMARLRELADEGTSGKGGDETSQRGLTCIDRERLLQDETSQPEVTNRPKQADETSQELGRNVTTSATQSVGVTCDCEPPLGDSEKYREPSNNRERSAGCNEQVQGICKRILEPGKRSVAGSGLRRQLDEIAERLKGNPTPATAISAGEKLFTVAKVFGLRREAFPSERELLDAVR